METMRGAVMPLKVTSLPMQQGVKHSVVDGFVMEWDGELEVAVPTTKCSGDDPAVTAWSWLLEMHAPGLNRTLTGWLLHDVYRRDTWDTVENPFGLLRTRFDQMTPPQHPVLTEAGEPRLEIRELWMPSKDAFASSFGRTIDTGYLLYDLDTEMNPFAGFFALAVGCPSVSLQQVGFYEKKPSNLRGAALGVHHTLALHEKQACTGTESEAEIILCSIWGKKQSTAAIA
jgi:hypothetical protein